MTETKRPINPGAESLLFQRFPVLDHGFVSLIDYMGTDRCIDKAARHSYLTQEQDRSNSEVRHLVRFLKRKFHTSPFEQAELKFQVCVPMGIWRQWVRHRTASINEASGRYIVLEEKLYVPEITRMNKQSKSSKQGSSSEIVDNVVELQKKFSEAVHKSFEEYLYFLDQGLAKEIARFNQPLSVYIDAVWKCDLHNLFHFLHLRTKEDAQWEFRQYAKIIESIVAKCYPTSWEAFVDYQKESLLLSRMERDVLRKILADMDKDRLHDLLEEHGCSKREVREFMEVFGK